MRESVLATKNNQTVSLVKQTIIFLALLGCFFSLMRNVGLYTNQYFLVSRVELDSGGIACVLSLCLSIAGYYLLPIWGKVRVLKVGVLFSVGGLLTAAVVNQTDTFIISAVFFSGGLAFSVPALVVLLKESLWQPLTAITYSLFTICMVSSLGLWAKVTSYYGFKELCCGLSVLLIIAVIQLRSRSVG